MNYLLFLKYYEMSVLPYGFSIRPNTFHPRIPPPHPKQTHPRSNAHHSPKISNIADNLNIRLDRTTDFGLISSRWAPSDRKGQAVWNISGWVLYHRPPYRSFHRSSEEEAVCKPSPKAGPRGFGKNHKQHTWYHIYNFVSRRDVRGQWWIAKDSGRPQRTRMIIVVD